jgi:3-hydroxybutyryl-CoA dehydrogenase
MLASSGGEVRLYDPNADQLEVARPYVEAELPRVVAGRSGALPGRLVLSRTVQAAVAETWMVVEAIPERLDPKREMFGDLDRLAPEDAILASNSSSYPTDSVVLPNQDRWTRPARFPAIVLGSEAESLVDFFYDRSGNRHRWLR